MHKFIIGIIVLVVIGSVSLYVYDISTCEGNVIEMRVDSRYTDFKMNHNTENFPTTTKYYYIELSGKTYRTTIDNEHWYKRIRVGDTLLVKTECIFDIIERIK